MEAKSKKQKGARFERFIAKEIEAMGLGTAHRELMSGGGFRKGDIACNLPFLIEAKNQKKLNWYDSIDQAKRQAEQGNFDKDKWALIVRDPRTSEELTDAYVIMDMWQWLKLLKKDSEPLIKKPDREFKYTLTSLKNICNKVIKDLE